MTCGTCGRRRGKLIGVTVERLWFCSMECAATARDALVAYFKL